MVAKRRIKGEQSQATDPDDKFIATTMEVTAWARKNTQKLVIGATSLAIILVLVVYYVSFRGSMEVNAANELDQIQQTAALGNPEAAKGRLGQFLERYGNTPAAGEARMMLGQLHLETGVPSEAVVVLAPMARDLANPLNLQAAFLLAAAYEDQGRFEDAEDLYMRLANRADLEFQVRDALIGASRMRARLGNFEGALALMEEIRDGMDPADPARPEVDMRIAELQELSKAS
jgi:tetratricopeptide (TPR) repeat protein